jgi:hypothetical protein
LDVAAAKTSRETSHRRPQRLALLPKLGVSGQILRSNAAVTCGLWEDTWLSVPSPRQWGALTGV